MEGSKIGTVYINNILRFIFNPFSNGPKHCIGKYLALIEVKCLLVYIVLKYKVVRGLDTEPTWVNRFVYTIKEENFVKLEEIKWDIIIWNNKYIVILN